MAADLNNNAGPQMAAAILQLERALYHLAGAKGGDVVAVEWVDDVSVHRNGATHLQEQDKHSVQKGATVLGDRSHGLWRTLHIWLEQIDERGSACARYLFVSNASADGKVAASIRAIGDKSGTAAGAVEVLRNVGQGRPSKIQTLIDGVLRRPDSQLENLLARVELVEGNDWSADRALIANGLGMDPGLNHDLIVSNLLGWLTEALVLAWRSGKPGMITREACLRQMHVISRHLIRQRLLPRPAMDVPVSDDHRKEAQTRDFVARLTEIRADSEIIYEAVEHFLQFAAERSRLTVEGDIPKREWTDRGERLRQRWRGVSRETKIEHRGRSHEELGRLILARTTFGHLEPLGNEYCQELYMTSGQYHRLADEDQVWWLPSRPGRANES